MPPGTTSNFFNSRQALFLGAGQRLAERHWRYVQALREEIDGPLDQRGLVAILTKVVSATGEFRALHLARYELFLAGVRDPSLQSDLMRLQNASLEIAVTLLQAAGFPDPNRCVQLLSSLLNGLLFDQLTASSTVLMDYERVFARQYLSHAQYRLLTFLSGVVDRLVSGRDTAVRRVHLALAIP